MDVFTQGNSRMTNTQKRVLALAKRKGILRVKDLCDAGIHPEYLRRLSKKGTLLRIGRGLYMPADAQPSTNISLAQAARRVPHGVVCLLSALRFHGIGTANPFEVWMALDQDVRRPHVEYPPLRIMRFSGKALTEGVERHRIESVHVRVYNPAKTVADCFKYRNKIGLDVAIEALRDCLQSRKCTRDQLWQYAKICRVTEVMRPYLEAVS
jgi:predicted transcriptional regulator of viral defense system